MSDPNIAKTNVVVQRQNLKIILVEMSAGQVSVGIVTSENGTEEAFFPYDWDGDAPEDAVRHAADLAKGFYGTNFDEKFRKDHPGYTMPYPIKIK